MEKRMKMVLVVDDDVQLLNMLVDYLKYQEFKAQGVENGLAVLDLCKQLLPDLIVSDIRMPKMDGISLLQGLKKNSQTRDIPVVFMSAYADDEMMETAKKLGASFFLKKPFPVNALDDVIEKILEMES